MIHKAYKFRLEPTDKQAKALSYIAGSCRFVYNHFLNIQKSLYEERKATGNKAIKLLNRNKMSSRLTQLKQEEETKWLKNSIAQSLQQTIMDLDDAILNWLQRKKGFPKFKKKGVHDSFRIPGDLKGEEQTRRVRIPKV